MLQSCALMCVCCPLTPSDPALCVERALGRAAKGLYRRVCRGMQCEGGKVWRERRARGALAQTHTWSDEEFTEYAAAPQMRSSSSSEPFVSAEWLEVVANMKSAACSCLNSPPPPNP